MQFVHQPLTWGFLLALLPLLIHLINLVRRRRVKWAAMDFLRQSYKKHRTWIWLKQFLLLMARMAVVALAVAMLAQWVTQQQWFALLGVTATHHYIVMDDSYSMADRTGGTTAFDQAQQALGFIATNAASQETRQKVTLIRFSQADVVSPEESVVSVADLNGEIVDASFSLRFEELRRGLEVTQLAVGPQSALRLVRQLVAADDEENDVVYLLSDFRERDWASPSELKQQLDGINGAGAEIHFVNCMTTQQSNLAIVDIQPANETRAAGVPLFVNVRVRNYGRQAESKVPLRVRTLYYDPQVASSSEPGELLPKEDEPPSVLIDEIPPGQTVTARTQVFFPQPGPHVVEAQLPEDPVATDNRRWCVVDLVENESVLIVEGPTSDQGTYYMRTALAPGQRTKTGIAPAAETPIFLAQTTAESLGQFRAIYLLNVDRLDARAVHNLEAFVRQGGGLGIFLGDDIDAQFYNEQLYRDGEGLFPVPLERDERLPAEVLENVPDFEVENHPIFSVFLGQDNPFIQWVTIERYIQLRQNWEEETGTTAQVIARLRNRQPLAVEKPFGAGRVVTFLTTLTPNWNNWAQDPSFVVTLLRMHAYLAATAQVDGTHLVGAPLEMRMDADKFLGEVVFVTPGREDIPLTIERGAVKPEPDSPDLVAGLGRPPSTHETSRSGIYEAWTRSIAGQTNVRRFALNVDGNEGDLARATSQTMAARLSPLKIQFREANQYAFETSGQAGANRSLLLMCLLIALLLGEQLLSYLTSYHPARSAAARA